VSRDDYYRQQAEDARKLADRSIREDDRASWLWLAQCWLRLIQGKPQTASEHFDDAATERGTGQDVSKEFQ
jgi:hypothetical protein